MSPHNGTDTQSGSRYILGSRVDGCSYDLAAGRITEWAQRRESRYVCIANVHVIMEAVDDAHFQEVLNEADLVTSDGMPLVWGLRALGLRGAERVYGPTLMRNVCQVAAAHHIRIALVGGAATTLEKLESELTRRFSGLEIAYAQSPPFRELSWEEELDIAANVNNSGAQILFVGLGCPKQERLMARLRGRVSAPMLGVGAAFDFLAGTKPMAPAILQQLGLEWAFRLITEPRRLWKRYLKHNPRFLWYFGKQLLHDAALFPWIAVRNKHTRSARH
jgi:N-acetylglucosaminyldiphosphoundecaprenol N-acetyl-beta-D-mannosaminyltransferase